uniref:NADH dehydrogenase subunit 3 n=1 Tax=Rhotana formosana TaxID=3081105 RepID=UPI002A83A04F|nr:NADH dehydrogenase subunit 3 [Rhotana formosana]WOW99132.1 NADH dehydrogenase subunit 3 [Rhotana formosana]
MIFYKIFMMMMTLLMMMTMMTMKMSKKTKNKREKNLPFECGFNQISSPRKSFSIHFFLLSLLFIVFDVEILLILPMSSTDMINIKEWLMFSLITMIILLLGIYHEWNMGMLEWTMGMLEWTS